MRFLNVLLGAGFTVASQQPIEGPFYLSAVPSNGSDPWPLNVGIVSRGVRILSQALEYRQEFTFDSTRNRLVITGDASYASGELDSGLPFIFVAEEGSWPLAQVAGNGSTYLVKEGQADFNQWHVTWRPESLPVQVDWAEPGSELANAALRVDLEIP